MIGFILRILVVMFGLWLASELVPGLEVQGTWTLMGAALVLGIVNAVVRPLVVILTLPITIITLGPFLLMINAGMLALVALVFENFSLSGFWSALLGSIVVSATWLDRVLVHQPWWSNRGDGPSSTLICWAPDRLGFMSARDWPGRKIR